MHVTRGELIELLVMAEDDNGDINRAKDSKLMGLLEEASFALEKGPERAN